MTKTMAQIAREDRKMMVHAFRSYKNTSAEAKLKRKLELVGDAFRAEGKIDNIIKNAGTARELQSRRRV